MNIVRRGEEIRIHSVDIDLRLTLMDSAQTFHWLAVNGAYYGVAAGRPVCVRETENGVALSPTAEGDEAHFVRYFDFAREYERIGRAFAMYPAARAVGMLPGMRVLNQSAWDALFMFILSSNNNAGRIRSLTLSLSEAFGQRHEINGVEFYSIPTPEELVAAGEEKMRGLGCGYRAAYLYKTARRIAEGFPLDALSAMGYEAAHARLMELPGVGDKVADCAQLFGMGHSEAFPVDVWVERLLRAWFSEEFAGVTNRHAMARRGRELFGKDAGIFQQFLFHAARKGLIPFSEEGEKAI